MIKYEKLDSKIAKKYEEQFIKYFQNVLKINDVKFSKEEIKNINQNMIKYLEDNTAKIIGAFDNDSLVGFIWAYEREINQSKRYHINYFIVDEKYQNHGIGKNLINEVYKIAKENNIKSVELMVTKSNEKAISFYKKEGFLVERISLCKDL